MGLHPFTLIYLYFYSESKVSCRKHRLALFYFYNLLCPSLSIHVPRALKFKVAIYIVTLLIQSQISHLKLFLLITLFLLILVFNLVLLSPVLIKHLCDLISFFSQHTNYTSENVIGDCHRICNIDLQLILGHFQITLYPFKGSVGTLQQILPSSFLPFLNIDGIPFTCP